MKKVIWTVGVSLALAIVMVAAIGVTTPARVTAEAGARLCGYIIMPLLQDNKTVVQNLSIMVEVPEGDSFLCGQALPEIRKEIKTNPALASLAKYYSEVRVTGEQINPGTAGNKWVYFTTATCENVGKSFGGQVGSKDICEGGHPQNGMNRLSTADGTFHSYVWTYAFYKLDPATGSLLGCNDKAASPDNPPCKLPAPKIAKQTKSKKAPW